MKLFSVYAVEVFILHVTFASMDSKFVKYEISSYFNARISSVISRHASRSAAECATMCTQTDKCIAFGFNGLFSCELSQYNPNDQLTSTVSDNGWKIYTSKPEECWPSGYNGFVRDGRCYFWTQSILPVSWTVGRDDCKAQGATLVCIESESENEALVDTVPIWLWWFGLNDIGENFFKCNGNVAAYHKWAVNQPGTDHCVAVYNNTRAWHTGSCPSEIAYVCEMGWY